jgi:hypothetical protein
MLTSEQVNELLKLSGMKYRQGYFNADYWKNITGVNPLKFPGYIYISKTGLCMWENRAEKISQLHSDQVKNNFHALGVH